MSNQAFSVFGKLIPTTLLALACQLLLLLLVIAFSTFLISNASYVSNLSNHKDKARKVAIIPYWIPYFGHLSLLLDRTSKLQYGRRNSPSGIFALKLFGTKYNTVWTPSLIDAAFEVHHASLSSSEPRWTLLRKVFSADGCGKDKYLHLYSNDHVSLQNALLLKGTTNLSQTTQTTLHAIQQHAPNLLSFAERPIDQNPWEQNANPVLHNSSLVEVSLFELISRFVAHVSLPTLVGTEFLEIHPTTVEDLWDLDGGFKWLRWGFSRLWGIPSLTRAHIARRRLLAALQSFHNAVDAVYKGGEAKQPWREIGDVSEVMKQRCRVWKRHGTSPAIRAACDLSLLWAMSTKPASLVFWMLLHIHTDPTLLTQIRTEIAPFALITQSPQVLSIPSPPRLSTNFSALETSCPLLKSCLYECLRLYTTPAPTRFVDKDTIISDTDEKVQSNKDYVLEKGSYITAPLTLLHHNPRYFWQPNEFQPRRFIKTREGDDLVEYSSELNDHLATPDDRFPKRDRDFAGQIQRHACLSEEHASQPQQTFHHHDSLHPFGTGGTVCPARAYAEAEILAFVAAILSLWEFEPAGHKGWVVPERRDGEIVSVPRSDLRVKVKAMKLS